MPYNKFAQIATRKAIDAALPTQPIRKVSVAFNLKFILQTLQKSLTSAKRFRKDDAISVTNVHVSYTVRVQEGNIIVQIAADDKARAVEGLDRLKQLFKQKHMRKAIRPERGIGFLAGKKLSGLWIIKIALIPPTGQLTVLTDEMYDELDINALNVWKGYLYSVLKIRTDADGIEMKGDEWEYENEKADTIEELLSAVSGYSWSEVAEDGQLIASDMELNDDWDEDDYDDPDDAIYDKYDSIEYSLELKRGDGRPLSKSEIEYLHHILL